jgi:D-glycero-alpha-D-manno-heptose-7-phosphate kinase
LIICRTPLRISLFGGGTDYPVWYREHGGQVISFTINKYSYITLRKLPPFFDYQYRIRYYQTEEVKQIADINHPVVREALLQHMIKEPLEIVHTSDLPARSGLGSSSTFTVGFHHALHTFKHYSPTKRELALNAINFEQEILAESVGSQDQVAAAFGGFNHIIFGGNSEFQVNPLPINKQSIDSLQQHLLLCFTGFQRNATDVALEQIKATQSKYSELKLIDQICSEGLLALNKQNICFEQIGLLLHRQWEIKRGMTKLVSNSIIDEIYELGRNAGAYGGKLLGAGGGGFMLFIADPKHHANIRAKLKQYMFVPIRLEFSGSNLIYFTHE